PKRWAAIVPVCGGGDPKQAAKIKDVPCWCFHGDADQVVKVKQSRDMIWALRQAGGEPLYHEYPGVGHNCWDRVYATPDLYEWLIEQKGKGEGSASTARPLSRPSAAPAVAIEAERANQKAPRKAKPEEGPKPEAQK